MSSRRIGISALVVLGLAASAAAQVPFTFLLTENGSAATLQSGASISFVTGVGSTETAQVQATYTGTGQVTILQQPNVFGNTAFKASIAATLPLTLTPNSSVAINIQFSPTSSSLVSGQLQLPYTETLSSTSSNSGTINFVLQGAAPTFTLSYVLATDQNVVPLQSGDAIPFAPTLVGATATATLNITNTGAAPGNVTGISNPGGAFSLRGKPLLPVSVPGLQTLPVTVVYTPTAVTKDTGQITVTFDSGSPVIVNLTGSGSASSFTYQILSGSTSTSVSPGGAISLPNTNVGQTGSVTVRVLNAGNANGTVNSISLSPGFQLSNGPATLPQTLAPNASLQFTVNFTPTQPGPVSGTLLVNSDSFSLSGVGLGPQLTLSYVAGGNTITLGGTNNSVFFSPVMVTQTGQVNLDVKNTGTLAATISNIALSQTNGPFSLVGLPPTPVTLAPGGDFQIGIHFTPVTVATVTENLSLDNTTIQLVGQGTQPPPLPSYTITGPSGTAAPLTQPTVGLNLAAAYPVAITGTLTLSVTGNLPADSAVQFSTGGKTVSFTIPANQTAAVFGVQGTQIGLQSGTVADTIILTPAFATQAGNLDLTPATPKVLQFSVAPGPPVLIALQVTGLTTTGFTLQVTGFTTTRTLTSAAIQLSTAPGFSLGTSQFAVDVTQVSTLWFQSSASQTFGGEFTMSIPFVFSGLATNQSIQGVITSATATMSNQSGTSTSLQAAIP